MIYHFHEDGSKPALDEYFVFGSNMSGIHGAGAARVAWEHYGAEVGNGFGLQGRSYAIPTKGYEIEYIPLHEFVEEIYKFVEFTQKEENAYKGWFVTRIGCGLAGFLDEEIAPHFKGAKNCSFAREWEKYLV